MAFRTIQIDLQFNANTSRARQQMQELQTQLNQVVASQPTSQLSLTPQLQQAQQAALQLKMALENAMNTDTGRLNLNKFQAQLNQSGISLKTLAAQMQALGSVGVQAFSNMTSMIAQADTRMFSLTGKAKSFLTSISHSAQYQLASTLIYGTINSFKETLDYAEKLDTSLNNIRIVTGKGADEMARFAKEANAMAKELSTSTTKYTDASLIYYQQGLGDREVKERTDVTVKLANVVGEEAATVSDWMTAIWNNFDNGSKSVEYYADVLATLGAATASSADEIADGLEKFAAVAETVGLSYEYATSALATITAEIRQSADVVGTALKTLFARIEGLKLGDTLEDGTTLNQYSLSLEKVGVNIKDANNELKDMDTILDETGARWDTLAKDEQVALAQSVAGIRQYTQFMALMDNWDVMKNNLELTEEASGALEEQQKIYEESAAAAQERMKANAEEFKSLIIGGDDMTKVYDLASDTLEVINVLFESFGGLKTIILAAAAALMHMYQPQLASFFGNMAVNIQNFGKEFTHFITLGKFGNANPGADMKKESAMLSSKMIAQQSSEESGVLASKHLKQQSSLQETLVNNSDRMSQSEQQIYTWRLQILESYQKEIEKAEDLLAKKRELVEASREGLTNNGYMTGDESAALGEKSTNLGMAIGHGEVASEALGQAAKNPNAVGREELANQVHSAMKSSGDAYSKMGVNSNFLKEDFAKITGNAEGLEARMSGENGVSAYDAAIDQLDQEFREGNTTIEQYKEKLDQINQLMSNVGQQNLQDDVDMAIVGSDNTDPSRAFNMANLSPTSTIDDMREAMNNQGGSMKVTGINGESTTFSQEATAIQTESQTNDKLLADAKKELTTAQNDYNKATANGGKATQKHSKALKDAQEKVDKYQAKQKELTKRTNNLRKAVKNQGKELRNQEKIQKKAEKTTKGLNDVNKAAAKDIKNFTKESIESGKETARHTENIKTLDGEVENLKGNMAGGNQGLAHWSESLAAGAQAGVSFLMGLSMISSAFETIGRLATASGDSMGEWVSSLSSLAMGFMFVIPAIGKMAKSTASLTANIVKAIIAKKAEKAATKASIGASKQKVEQDNIEGKSSEKKGFKSLMAGILGITEDAGKGPTGWAIALGSLAMVAGIASLVGVAVGGIGGGAGAAKEEETQEDIDSSKENLEAIDENQELAESVTDLTKEYKNLRNAGESTAEVLENMREKIPDLIDSYKELAKTLGLDIDISSLEDAYKIFEQTGDITQFEEAQAEVDEKVASAEKSEAKNVAGKAKGLALEAASNGVGDGFWDDEYRTDVGSIDDSEDKEMFKEVFGKYYDEDKKAITFDSTNTGEVVDAYNRMLQARAKLEETHTDEELEDLDYYNKLNEEIQELSKNMSDVIEGQQKLYDIEKEEALANQSVFNDEVFGSLDDKITDVQSYTEARQDLIDKLVEEKQWTEAQAEAYLKSSEAFGKFEDTISQFGEDIDHSKFDQSATAEEIEAIKKWFANLPEEERTLAMTIDYTVVGNVKEAEAALEEARQKMRVANATKEATDLGADQTTFETYAEILQLTNSHLEENEAAAYEVAAANYRVNKGIEELNKTWDESVKKMRENSKGTYAYAEGLGEITKALTTMFGVKPSVNFVETHLNDIEKMLSGDKEAFEKLQDQMAEDYVSNIVIEPDIVFDGNSEAVAQGTEEIRNALQGALDELGNLEVGQEVTLSENYTKVLQQALDSGQLTAQQLEEAFKLKGYDLNFKTKPVPGPTTHYERTYNPGTLFEYTVKYDESSTMQVPLLEDSDVSVSGGGGGATAVKVADSTSINDTSIEDRKEKTEDRLENLDDEIDRYHEIEEVISDTERKLNKLSAAKDRVFGGKKLALMNQEIKAQKQLIKNNEKLLEEAKQYYKQDRSDLLNNYAVKLDKQGRIANYEELQQSYINRMKSAANDEEAYNDIKEEYDNFKDAASKYEESLNKVEEQAETLQEELYNLQDLAMEKIEYKIQMKIDMADDDRKLAEFLMSKYEDDDFATVEKIKSYTDTTKADMKAWNANQRGIEKVQKDLAAGKISEEDAIAKLRELRDEQISLVEGMEETRASVFESLSTMFDAWNEKFDTQIAKIEHLKNVTQSYKNIVDIVGKDNLGISDETMKKLNQVNVQASQEQMYAARKKKEENEKYLANLQKARADAKAKGQDTSYWDDLIEDAEEKVRESTEEFMGSWEEALQAAADAFAANVEQIAENFSEGVSGIYKNLDELEAAFERQTTLSDLYLKNYEKSYEISKLNRSIQDSIDKTDNVGSQKELRDLQRELLEMNKEGTKVSKYDIEYMQKKYDLMVAEQALKDAQNAKSTVRLRRDSEGNYGYVYTADQDTVGKAEQNYEDKLYAMQQFGDNLVLEAQKQYIALNQAYKDAMLEISQDMTLNDEEKKAKMAEITRYYQDQMQYWADQSNSIMLRGTEINAQYGAQMATSFHDTILGQMFPDINSFDQLYGQSIISMNGSTTSFNGAVEELGRTVDSIMSDAGYDVEDFADNVDNYLGDAQEDLADTREESNELAAAMEEDMSAGVSAVENFESEYANKMESIRSETQKTINKINKLIKRLNALDKAKDSANDDDDEDYTGTGDGTTKKPTTVKPTTKPTTVKPTTVKPTTPKTKKDPFFIGATFNTKKFPGNIASYGQAIQYSDGSWGNLRSEGTNIDFTRTGDIKTGEEFKIYGSTIQDGVTYLAIGRTDGSSWAGTTDINTLSFIGSPVTRWVKKSTLKNLYTGYDTGGYTGEWGPEGRMAMLHQKEIVLNAHDTENFLTAIGIVRDISDQIEKNAIAMQYINQLRGYGATINPSNGTLQQDITIHAEFPNATNHSEIEEAFRNLGNLASQYANRKS